MILTLIGNGFFFCIVVSLRRFVTLPEVLMQHLNQHTELKTHVKVYFALEHAMKAQRESRFIALLFL
jgi:hypothetical protein